jgi:hypothetical protein
MKIAACASAIGDSTAAVINFVERIANGRRQKLYYERLARNQQFSNLETPATLLIPATLELAGHYPESQPLSACIHRV